MKREFQNILQLELKSEPKRRRFFDQIRSVNNSNTHQQKLGQIEASSEVLIEHKEIVPKFKINQNVKKHRSETEKLDIKCETCGQLCHTLSRLLRHKRNAHLASDETKH